MILNNIQCDIEIPEGYEIDRHGIALRGESFLSDTNKLTVALNDYKHSKQFILKKKGPKLIPFTKETISRDAWYRQKNTRLEFRIANMTNAHIWFTSGNDKHWAWDEVLTNMEHSTDNGKTWKPCGLEFEFSE